MVEHHVLGMRIEHLAEALRQHDRVVVALSGGVDSGALLALTVEILGAERVLAVTGRSASLAESDLADARAVCEAIGATHEVVDTFELDRPAYRANAGDRCYHCRTELFEVLGSIARRRGYDAVLYGAIPEDEADVRPGMRAAEERGVLAPLVEAGLTKEDVRRIARERGLPVHDKPASACLASRIPIGVEVTAERLAMVARAEAGLRELGIVGARVRHHGEIARLELAPAAEARLLDPTLRQEAVAVLRRAGFRHATLDLAGYRPAGLTDLLQSIGAAGTAPKRDGGQ